MLLLGCPTVDDDDTSSDDDDTGDDDTGDDDSGDDDSAPGSRWLQVSTALNYSCGLLEDGEIVCWGDLPFAEPQGPFQAIGAGSDGLCGLTPSGGLRCGGNALLMDNPSGSFTQITVGGDSDSSIHGCALDDDGVVSCWGSNGEGQCAVPESTYVQVAAGAYHTCALDMEGRIDCWGCGSFDYGQCEPTVEPHDRFIAVDAGDNHTCAVRDDTTIICWGFLESPELTFTGFEVAAVGSGTGHSCASFATGDMECWGSGEDGQTDGPGGAFTQLDGGRAHTCGVLEDGTLLCWGRDDEGQCDVPE